MTTFVLDCSVTMSWVFPDEASETTDISRNRDRSDEVVSHSECTGGSLFDQCVKQKQYGLANEGLAFQFQRPSVYMPLQQDFQHEDSIRLSQHPLYISRPETIGNSDKGIWKGLFADVVQESDIGIQNDSRRRQVLE